MRSYSGCESCGGELRKLLRKELGQRCDGVRMLFMKKTETLHVVICKACGHIALREMLPHKVNGWDNWIGVDLDGTLAHYDGWKGKEHIGEPIGGMLFRVKKWIADGQKVKIFTARASEPEQIPYVMVWLEKHGIGGLEVTNVKDFAMIALYDDRAVQIIPNEGVRVDGCKL